MYFLWLGVGLFLGLVGWLVLGWWRGLGRVLLVLGVVVCLGVTVWRVVGFFGEGVGPQVHRGQASVGYVLGHRFLKDVEGRVGSVVLVFPPEGGASAGALDSFYEGFGRVLAGFPGFVLEECVVGVSARAARRGEVDVEAFGEALAGAEGALAVVSWVGFPEGAEDLALFVGEGRPLVYVFDGFGRTNWFGLVGGVVEAGVVPRVDVEEGAGLVGSPGVVFGARYRLVEGLDGG